MTFLYGGNILLRYSCLELWYFLVRSFDYYSQVCCTYADGYKLRGAAIVGGPRSIEKANRTMDEIISRLVKMNSTLQDTMKMLYLSKLKALAGNNLNRA